MVDKFDFPGLVVVVRSPLIAIFQIGDRAVSHDLALNHGSMFQLVWVTALLHLFESSVLQKFL